MEIRLPNGLLLISSQETEAFSFGGLWQADFAIGEYQLPGKYLLDDNIIFSDRYCVLRKIEVFGKWRSGIRFSIVVIDIKDEWLLLSKENFAALSIICVDGDSIFYEESFGVSYRDDNSKSLDINNEAFVKTSIKSI